MAVPEPLTDYRQFTKPAELHKAINTLRGMVAGISCNDGISAAEIQEISHWCSLHAHLRDRHPFSELLPVIEASLQDGAIDEEEQKDILWLCSNFTDSSSYYDDITSSIQFLNGMVHGMMADGRLDEAEIHALRVWLDANDFLQGTYPFDELTTMVHTILEDNVITADERNSLVAFMSNLVEFKDSYNLVEADYDALRKKYSIAGICAYCPEVEIPGKVFCFTGESYRSTRSEIRAEVERLGGIFRPSVSGKTDFLVVGNAGNPCWAYSCYGRKIEEAVALRKNGAKVQIINETDFWDAVWDGETFKSEKRGIKQERKERQPGQDKPSQQELEVCAYIQDIISRKDEDIEFLRFKKGSGGYVDVYCLYIFLKFKFTGKGNYILVKSGCAEAKKYVTEPCTQSEGGTDYLRVYFSTPFDLEPLSEYICEAFADCYKSMKEFVSYSNHKKQEAEEVARSAYALTGEETATLLVSAKSHEFTPVPKPETLESAISRSDVSITAIHKRVPLTEIRNAENQEQGFKIGFPYWEEGEAERLDGNLAQAIELFDKARLNGYGCPALYDSYAMAYRRLKDYSNEIAILDEAITRLPGNSSRWKARREKAIKLLYDQQENERKAADRARQKAAETTAKN